MQKSRNEAGGPHIRQINLQSAIPDEAAAGQKDQRRTEYMRLADNQITPLSPLVPQSIFELQQIEKISLDADVIALNHTAAGKSFSNLRKNVLLNLLAGVTARLKEKINLDRLRTASESTQQ